ncbi:hypothetical protein Pse7367_3918 (plasmid) [Thalassoporum mexicanum PCC 7367]|uniref:hypothetical protein n=1 Tax=Thalassoporum mexicanum TaxID=3457544 RepID=UPI00029FD245|nr:hypothetical protein [Pseudanabaena sp. PCC 7367]AFY72135.1 hypothetical protein Pse7367_3918 [Pseudanabaena sp. PCC 7367]
MPANYRPQATDTSPITDQFEFALLRQRTNSDRLKMSAGLTQSIRQLCLAGWQQNQPHWSKAQLAQKLAQAFLGDDVPGGFVPQGNAMSWIQDSITLALQLQEILTTLAIPHYITNGIAASAYGEPRSTRDLDVVISISLTELDLLVERLKSAGFYVPGIEDVRNGTMHSVGSGTI